MKSINELMICRKIKTSDLSSLIDIENSVQVHAWTSDALIAWIEKSDCCWVAEKDARIAAYIFISQVKDEAEILNIATHPLFQRQGAASFLLEEMIKKAVKQEVKTIYLDVRESNIKAISLYEKFGFQSYGKRKNYYVKEDGSKEDALLFQLVL